MRDFIKGMDVSSVKELEACGAKFYDGGKQGDLFAILKNYGVNAIRLRVWNDPYSETGEPYGAGCNDEGVYVELARRAKECGMDVLLDLHYSDFWTDPGKQFLPKAWRGFSDDQLEKAVYDYTLVLLGKIKAEGAYPSMVQVGNELTNGFLWPNASKGKYLQIARFVNAGIDAVRKTDPALPIMVHLDAGGKNDVCVGWFDSYFACGGKDFDYLGLSYYPFWQGGVPCLKHNMDDLAVRYGKKIVVVELGMGWTVEDYAEYEKLSPSQRKGMAATAERAKGVGYPMSKQGQCDFIRDVLESIQTVPNGLGAGFFYWEPAWIPVSGSGWALKAGLEYIEDPGPGGNEWANQALFDYDGNALPSLAVIRDF